MEILAADPNLQDDTMRELYNASLNGCVSTLKTLIHRDPLILSRVSLYPFSETPLHIASLLGHLEFCMVLLDINPSLAGEVNSEGRCPLHLASAKGHTEIVKALLVTKPDICSVRDKDDKLPLHFAAMRGRVEAIKELISARPDSIRDMTENDDGSILHLCVRYNHLEALKILVESVRGDNQFLSAKDQKDNTVLHLAVRRRQIKIIQYLLSLSEMSTTINTLNRAGLTPLDMLEHCPIDFITHTIEHILTEGGAERSANIVMAQQPVSLTPRLTGQQQTPSQIIATAQQEAPSPSNDPPQPAHPSPIDPQQPQPSSSSSDPPQPTQAIPDNDAPEPPPPIPCNDPPQPAQPSLSVDPSQPTQPSQCNGPPHQLPSNELQQPQALSPSNDPPQLVQPSPNIDPPQPTQPSPSNVPPQPAQPLPSNDPQQPQQLSPSNNPLQLAQPLPINNPPQITQPSQGNDPPQPSSPRPLPSNNPQQPQSPSPHNEPTQPTHPSPSNGPQPSPDIDPSQPPQPSPCNSPPQLAQPLPSNDPRQPQMPSPSNDPLQLAQPSPINNHPQPSSQPSPSLDPLQPLSLPSPSNSPPQPSPSNTPPRPSSQPSPTPSIANEQQHERSRWDRFENFCTTCLVNQGNWIGEKTKEQWLVAATVIATMTFQSVISPPGGVWQADTTDGGYACTDYGFCEAGTAVVGYVWSPDFLKFIFFNSTSFFASLCVVLVLISGFPLQNKVIVWILAVLMLVAITCMLLTYMWALGLVSPNHIYYRIRDLGYLLVGTWIVLLVAAGFIQIIRVVFWVRSRRSRSSTNAAHNLSQNSPGRLNR